MGGRDSEMLQIACKGKFFWGGRARGGYHTIGGVVPLPNPDMVLGIFGAWRGQWTWG